MTLQKVKKNLLMKIRPNNADWFENLENKK